VWLRTSTVLGVHAEVMLTLHVEYAMRRIYTVFYSYLACFMNTVVLNIYVFLSNAGFIRRNTVCIFLWLRPRIRECLFNM